jgi:cytolysin-activating lysine-acyltransferase
MLGEMTWLLTQSPLHKALPIEAIEWLIMPALIHEQFYVFRDGERPVGLALWAKCNPQAEAKLDKGMLEPENRLTLEEWKSGETIWLVDLIAPFANDENKHREIMVADLIAGPLSGKAFKFHQTNPATGERTVQSVDADAGERLKAAIKAATDSMGSPQ